MQLRTLLCNGVQISLLFSIACALFLSPRGWYPPASPLDPSQRVASVSPLERTARKIIEAVRPRTHAIIAPLNWVGRVHEADLRRSERGLRGGHYLWAYRCPDVRRAKPVQLYGLAERDAGSDRAGHLQRRLCSQRRDDSDARRRKAAHGDPGAERGQGRADFADAHAV